MIFSPTSTLLYTGCRYWSSGVHTVRASFGVKCSSLRLRIFSSTSLQAQFPRRLLIVILQNNKNISIGSLILIPVMWCIPYLLKAGCLAGGTGGDGAQAQADISDSDSFFFLSFSCGLIFITAGRTGLDGDSSAPSALDGFSMMTPGGQVESWVHAANSK